MRLEEVVRNRNINWYVEYVLINRRYAVLSVDMILHGRNFHTYVNAN